MRITGVFLTAALLAATAGGLTLAQVDQSVERAAPPPPGEAPPAPAAEPITPAADANAVAPDEEAPPPPAMTSAEEAEAEQPAAAAPARNQVAAATANVQEEAPPPPPPPLKRPRFTAAILQAVDKPTGDTLRFEAKVGQPLRYKGLTLTVRACETNNAGDDDFDEAYAHLEVSSQPQTVAGRRALAPRQVFRGWMFAASQGLHPLEHPVYDLWLIACKTDAPAPAGASL